MWLDVKIFNELPHTSLPFSFLYFKELHWWLLFQWYNYMYLSSRVTASWHNASLLSIPTWNFEAFGQIMKLSCLVPCCTGSWHRGFSCLGSKENINISDDLIYHIRSVITEFGRFYHRSVSVQHHISLIQGSYRLKIYPQYKILNKDQYRLLHHDSCASVRCKTYWVGVLT